MRAPANFTAQKEASPYIHCGTGYIESEIDANGLRESLGVSQLLEKFFNPVWHKRN